MWENIQIDLGRVLEKKTTKFAFKWKREEIEIIKITPSCNCTDVKWESSKRELSGTFKGGVVPHHLKVHNGGEYKTHKTITITYKYKGGERKDVLSVIATVYRNGK